MTVQSSAAVRRIQMTKTPVSGSRRSLSEGAGNRCEKIGAAAALHSFTPVIFNRQGSETCPNTYKLCSLQMTRTPMKAAELINVDAASHVKVVIFVTLYTEDIENMELCGKDFMFFDGCIVNTDSVLCNWIC